MYEGRRAWRSREGLSFLVSSLPLFQIDDEIQFSYQGANQLLNLFYHRVRRYRPHYYLVLLLIVPAPVSRLSSKDFTFTSAHPTSPL